ncbi:MAG: 50S ribosomal protein L27 [Patescibacteria group bacterium]|nr:50S ribosomal protein L27 [Patescibacteria group bacterium]
MAHVVSGGSKASQGVNIAGRRLGIKLSGGALARKGNIIIRQKGTVYHAGKNVGIGRDHTLFAKEDGIIQYRNMTGYKKGRKIIDVIKNKKAGS